MKLTCLFSGPSNGPHAKLTAAVVSIARSDSLDTNQYHLGVAGLNAQLLGYMAASQTHPEVQMDDSGPAAGSGSLLRVRLHLRKRPKKNLLYSLVGFGPHGRLAFAFAHLQNLVALRHERVRAVKFSAELVEDIGDIVHLVLLTS